MAGLVTGLILSFTSIAHALVGLETLKSGISIFINNDLTEKASLSADSGILLLDPMPLPQAINSCRDIGEVLWPVETRLDNIRQHLEYLVFQQQYNQSQAYWVAGADGNPTALYGDGRVDKGPSDTDLPVLCTQTAPYSIPDAQNISARWQVSLRANNEYITGFRDHRSFRFLGVRYGNYSKRWTHSKVYEGSGNNASALEYGSMCLQVPGGSEDCLFLNIWTPYLPDHKNKKSLRAVMIWFHGGEYRLGSGNDPNFDGGNLASRGDVVVVTVNYRLGTLGFLALDDGETKGNYGLGDQFTALDWVRQHIDEFGGDPSRITIFGQSSGASTGRVMLSSPRSLGKFSGVIMQSNPGGLADGSTYSKYYTIAQEMDVAGHAILHATNCTNVASRIDCLRALPTSSILEVIDLARYLVVDGHYIQAPELDLFHPPKTIANVPMMIGMARDDSAWQIDIHSDNDSIHDVLERLELPSFITPSREFPIPAGGDHNLNILNTSSRIDTDATMRCINQATGYAGFTKGVFSDVYFYEFNRTYQMPEWSPNSPRCEAPVTPDFPHGDPNKEYFKCHQGEIYYVFGNIQRSGRPLRDQFDLPFEQYVLDAWASFARSGNPNPELGFLKARGYWNTTRQMEMAEPWVPFQQNDYRLRLLQWPSKMMTLNELDQCRVLNMSLHMYDI
ncbi:hypothetical protein N7492_002602 [Penicillium capsulatum]|uniref:Carboxylic ester hydrolase n=1 Tax=Penicillium capsulatum TaxID=69766 RepID=A0A9W9LWL3_9EURO|nr:hypothetical protein N7492_002602 [Penicillium capsulatum]KAJ6122797.1 hypothetical protein N7512_005262 [Penicillium capsulatum]